MDRLQADLAHRDLHDDVLVPGGDAARLRQQRVELRRDALGRDRAIDDRGDLQHAVAVLDALLGEERRVRRDAVDDAERGAAPDLVDVRGVHEDLHRCTPVGTR